MSEYMSYDMLVNFAAAPLEPVFGPVARPVTKVVVYSLPQPVTWALTAAVAEAAGVKYLLKEEVSD